jgi:Clathrin light chain
VDVKFQTSGDSWGTSLAHEFLFNPKMAKRSKTSRAVKRKYKTIKGFMTDDYPRFRIGFEACTSGRWSRRTPFDPFGEPQDQEPSEDNEPATDPNNPSQPKMADRFPSLEEFDSGGEFPLPPPHPLTLSFKHWEARSRHLFWSKADPEQAQTEAAPFDGATGDDFLTREKALLGDDANQFATGHDNAAFVEDGDDDFLGGGGGGGGEEVTEFESSFPAIDTRNEVSYFPPFYSHALQR